MKRLVPLLPLALAFAGCGCGDGATPPDGPSGQEARTWPEGTWLAVDDVAIPKAEVDRVAARLALVYPGRSAASHRRDALSSFVLPRAAVRSAHAGAREEALVQAEAALAELRAAEAEDSPFGPQPILVRGGFDELDLQTWGAARELEDGIWGLFERIGGFQLLRVEGREAGRVPGLDVLEVSVLDFPYLPPDFSSMEDWQRTMEGALLSVVDPRAEDDVPERLRYTMRGRGGAR